MTPGEELAERVAGDIARSVVAGRDPMPPAEVARAVLELSPEERSRFERRLEVLNDNMAGHVLRAVAQQGEGN